MSEDEIIEELMLQWEIARDLGKNPTPEDLCAEHPDLTAKLRQRLHAVQMMEQVLGVKSLGPPPTLPQAGFGSIRDSLPQIPGYEIIRVIEQGGMGVVYEARQKGLERRVAIKMISDVRLGPTQIQRFRSEAEASARLQHPNFVQIFEVGEVNGKPFFSMEFVEGGSLAQQLSTGRPDPQDAAELVSILAQAIQSAHAYGIVHRDLKPSNVLLTVAGVPKIADFGLVKRLDDDSGHTRTGEILGTPSYMAPEQAAGRKDLVGLATDVYALGAILYEMLTGQPPFRGETALDTLRQVMSEDPVNPTRFASGIPIDLEAICLKCLEKGPSARYLSAQDLDDDLRRFLNGQPVRARRSGRARKAWKWIRRHPQTATLAVALTMFVGLFVIYLIEHNRIQSDIDRQNGQDKARLELKAKKESPLVREILNRHCYECHFPDSGQTKKPFDILDHGQLVNSERKIVVPGDPDNSRLIQRIADGSMPPEEEETRLPRLRKKNLSFLKIGWQAVPRLCLNPIRCSRPHPWCPIRRWPRKRWKSSTNTATSATNSMSLKGASRSSIIGSWSTCENSSYPVVRMTRSFSSY